MRGDPARRVWSVEQVRALGVRTDLVTAGQVLGIGRTVAYDLARRGEFPVPVVRVGRKYLVPVAALLELLRVSQGSDPAELSDWEVRTDRRARRGRR